MEERNLDISSMRAVLKGSSAKSSASLEDQ